ncbi:MAG: LytTR family DNA-binding domain-containing protein [Wenzhouxiangellaceae bacterium]
MRTELKVAVVEDEPLALDLLNRWLEELSDVTVVGAASSVKGARHLLATKRCDLLLLDINLADESGLQWYQELPQNRRPEVVFVTAYSEFAVQAFRVDAVDYLLKPFDQQQLYDALERFRQRHASRQLLSSSDEYRQREKLRIKEGDWSELVEIGSIRWIESAGGYSVLHTAECRHVIRDSLSALETRLGTSFQRVHRSRIVNLHYVTRYKPLLHGDALLCLCDGTELRLSRRYRQVLERLDCE